jgi:uncharacterized protein YndB with AHSA1/START domain
MRFYLAALAALALAGPAAASVTDAQPNGFEVVETQQVAAPPAAVYAAIGRFGDWWSSVHSYSHDAKNYHLDLTAGGCLCEQLPDGGGAAHMRVIMVEPNALVRLEGALGPLGSAGGVGHLTWKLTPKDGGTEVVLTYDFGGYMKGGLQALAAPVDSVLGEQTARLKRYVETGRPDAPGG